MKLIIVGAGGLGREVYDYAREAFSEDQFDLCGFIDDRFDVQSTADTRSPPLLGTIRDYEPDSHDRLIVAIGEPSTRAEICTMLKSRGAEFATLVHPKAHVSSSAEVGLGSVIAPFATIGAWAQLGAFSHVHYYASAAHDTVIGKWVSLSPYAVVNGGAHLADGVFLGTRATINPARQVGEASKVTAGSVVYQDVPAYSIAHGNPAKARRQMACHPKAGNEAGILNGRIVTK